MRFNCCICLLFHCCKSSFYSSCVLVSGSYHTTLFILTSHSNKSNHSSSCRSLLWECHYDIVGTNRRTSLAHLIGEANLAGGAGGVVIGTIIRRCRNHNAIAVNIQIGRGRLSPFEARCIYSSHLFPLASELNRSRCRRRSWPGLRAVSPACVGRVGDAPSSAPDDHFAPGPHSRGVKSARGRVGRAGGNPTVCAGIVSSAGVQRAGSASAPNNHFTPGPDCRVI